jgi:hypothetical protein
MSIRRILIPLVVSAAGIAGAVGLAGAQETPSTTTPPATEAPAPAPAPGNQPDGQPGQDRQGCDHRRDGSTPGTPGGPGAGNPAVRNSRAVIETFQA